MKFLLITVFLSLCLVNVLCFQTNRLDARFRTLLSRLEQDERDKTAKEKDKEMPAGNNRKNEIKIKGRPAEEERNRNTDGNGKKVTGNDSKKKADVQLKGPEINNKRSINLQQRSTGSALSSAEATKIVQLHNNARQNVQPPALNMPNLHWDTTLASIAQTYADMCIWAHNPDRSSSSGFWYVGENIFVQTQTAQDPVVDNGFNSWDNEKNDYHYDQGPSGECDENKVCGHYTQIIWAETTAIGCGKAQCPNMSYLPHFDWNPYWEFLVCNYGLGGNFWGEKPYTEDTLGRK